MKVLFAVSNEKVSENIIKRYQKEYKEILSFKNVYYFDAILKEIQKDKSYDRIVISEDLEPFSNNNYDAIDKFIFDKLDNISDEAQDIDGNDTAIVLICSDRRTKGSSFLVKIFGIGIYNALLGTERSMEQVCRLINKPRVKKEAKMYYKIDSDDVNYSKENDKEVSELEIQNINTHFKKLGKNTDKFAESFANIAAQYTDDQLRIIINCLPINVKAVLEEDSPKYQELMSAGGGIQKVNRDTLKARDVQKNTGIKIDIIESKMSENKMSGPIVIPASVRTSKNKTPQPVRPQGNNLEVPEGAESSQNKTRKIVRQKSEGAEPTSAPVNKQPVAEEPAVKNVQEPVQKPVQKPVQPATPGQTPKATEQPKIIKKKVVMPDGTVVIKKVRVLTPEEKAARAAARAEEARKEQLRQDQQGLAQKKNDETGVEEAKKEEPEVEEPKKEEPKQEEPKQEKKFRPSIPPVIENKDKFQKQKEPDEDEFLLPMEAEEDDEDVSLPGIDDDLEENTLPDLDDFDDDALPGLDDFEDDSLPGLDDDFEDTTLPGLDDVEEEETLPGLDDEEVEEEVLPGLDDEEVEEEVLPGLDDEEVEEEVFPGLDDEEVEEEVLPGLDDEEVEEEVLPGLDDVEEVEEEVLPGLDDVEVEEEVLPGLDDEVEEIDTVVDDGSEEVVEEEVISGLDDEEVIEEETLPGLEDNDTVEELPSLDDDFDDGALPGLDDEEEYTDEVELPDLDDLDDIDISADAQGIPGVDDDFEDGELISDFDEDSGSTSSGSTEIESIKPKVNYSMSNLNSLLTKDKKIVTFLGTTKNGTSFLVNNLAAFFSSVGINTAILDMTKNRNSYYIYTNNEEELRNTAYNSISKLLNGFSEGIKVNKNLTVFTALPNDGKDYSDAETILSTLVQNYSLILIDCDFDTPPAYFASCQEIYLVQSMDILTIQPLTAFLRDLKNVGVLEPEKVRVVVNKEMKVKGLTEKAIIGGMSFYNDPSMSYMNELFNKDMVKACTIPFDTTVYAKYLEAIAMCSISINVYPKSFLSKLQTLANMVFPVVSKATYGSEKTSSQPSGGFAKKGFSKDISNTLNQMKKKY